MKKGTTNGTQTDFDGKFSISVESENSILIVSYLGFVTNEIAVNNQTNISITLQDDSATLDEVVIVGYGEVKKSDLTGSVVVLKSDAINASPVVSADQALVGIAAGVRVTQSSGAPGSGTTIRIRGGNSITAGNEPLFVIDGIPGVGDLSLIDPNDIASMQILKDASATSIYGARGANGVVLIITKKGKNGRTSVNYNSYVGIQSVYKTIDLLNATEYANLVNEVDTQQGVPLTYPNAASLGEGTNWQDEIFRDAIIQNHQVSFSGGNDKGSHYMSASVFQQDGIIINSGIKRYSLRLNLDNQFTDWLNVGTRTTLSRLDNNAATTNALAALQFSPAAPVRDSNGDFAVATADGRMVDNPVANATLQTNDQFTTKVLSTIYGEATITDALKFKVSLAADATFFKGNNYSPRTLQSQASVGGSASITTYSDITLLNENLLSYKKDLDDKNHIDAVAGFTVQKFRREGLSASASNFTTDALTFNNLGTATDPGIPQSDSNEWGILSYLARVNFTHNKKYLFHCCRKI